MQKTALVLSVVLFTPMTTTAGGDFVPPVTDPLVKRECGACHMAYQPAFLPVASWRKIMATLDNHFGEDASLDIGVRDKIGSYLMANSRRGSADRAKSPLRITKLNWFRREHRESKINRLRKERTVKTLADCGACHRGADRGYFEDD